MTLSIMSDTDHIVSPGTLLANRYELTEEIGRGGFGRVYRARQLNMDREVAIKILPPRFIAVSDVVARFRREARLASRLRHPHTITVHDYGKHENLLFIVMELLEGQDLADVLMEQPTLSMERMLHISRQVLESLEEAHRHNIVHRDLKPENVFLTHISGDPDYVKVVDFGIAKLAMPDVSDGDEESLRKLTMNGSTVGTPTYMSPEQAAGEDVDAATDLYALGIMLYEMACGRPPFGDDNPVKVMRAHLFEDIPRFPPGRLRDSRFEQIVRRSIHKDIDQRFTTAQAFLDALSGGPERLLEATSSGFGSAAAAERSSDSDDTVDSGNMAFDRTAAFEVDSPAPSNTDNRRDTESTLAANTSGEDRSGQAVPFDSVPDHPRGDRVAEAATSASTDSSGSSRSDLHNGPPAIVESGSSSSSIVTVLKPGPQEDVILLTNDDPADSTGDIGAPSAPSDSTPPPSSQSPGFDRGSPAISQTRATKSTSASDQWSWGRRDQLPRDGASQLANSSGHSTALKAWVALLALAVAAATVAYLNDLGYLDLF